MKFLKFSFPIAALSFCLASCGGVKNIDRFVNEEYESRPPISVRKQQQYFIPVTTSKDTAWGNKYGVKTGSRSKMLPLIIYFKAEHEIDYKLNPVVAVSNFAKTVNTYSSQKLKEKIGSGTLLLSVEKFPDAFSFVDKAHFVIPFVTWSKITFQTKKEDFLVSFSLQDNGIESKKGTISIPFDETKMGLSVFKSLKSDVSNYLSLYDSYITTVSKKVVDDLLKQL